MANKFWNFWSYTTDDKRYAPDLRDVHNGTDLQAIVPWTLVVQSKVKGCYIAHQSTVEMAARHYHKIYCDFLGAGDVNYVHLYDPSGALQDNPSSLLNSR